MREIPREGTLLPETYKFPRGTTRDQVIQRMQQTQKRVLAEIWERRNPDTPAQVAGPAGDAAPRSSRRKPAGPTSAAASPPSSSTACGRRSSCNPIRPSSTGWWAARARWGGRSSAARSPQPSPYNTYVIDGLPPGPIANPGRASLEATANPARTRDLFFVADGTGGHAFTETYDQHQKNVAKLRAMEKQIQNDTAEPAEDEPAPAAAGAPGAADTNPTGGRRRRPTNQKKPPRSVPQARGPARPSRARRAALASRRRSAATGERWTQFAPLHGIPLSAVECGLPRVS